MPNTPLTAAKQTLPLESVLGELDRIAQSPSFRKAERCLGLLQYVVRISLEGRNHELKEYTLGVKVFNRPEDYDPRADPVVRLEARRLRLKLAEYYQNEGSDDPLIIDLPKGAYIPEFRLRAVSAQVAEDPPQSIAPPTREPEAQALPQPIRQSRLAIWLTAVIVVAASGVAARYVFGKRSANLPIRASVAVLGFNDLSPAPEASWVSAALSELMNFDLGAEQRLRVLPLENVVRMRRELSVRTQSDYPAQLLQRIGLNLGADYVVSGSYSTRARRMRMQVMVFEARSGQLVAAIREESSEDRLAELARQCANRIRAQLGVRVAAAGAPPFEAAGMEPYARGMEALRQGDALHARAFLENAVAAAPSNPLIHSGLAAAWSALGMDTRATQEAKIAFESAGSLERVQQLEIEGSYRAMAHDWPRAIQVYQALVTLSPDDLEYGLLLAGVQARAGKGHDALAVVGTLRKLPPPLGDDPRIDLAEAVAAGSLSDFQRTRKAAQMAAQKASARGARWQYAKARLLEAGAMQTLNVPGFAEMRLEARNICAELGDRACVAAAYRIEANGFAEAGALKSARPLYAAALNLANELGNVVEKLNALIGIAFVDQQAGDLRAAEADDRAALAVASEMGPQKIYSVSLELSTVLADEGRLPEAQKVAEQALQLAKSFSEQEGIGLANAEIAHALALRGRFGDAAVRYEEAVATLRRVQAPWDLAMTLLDLSDAELMEGNVVGARKSYEEARAVAKSFPDNFVQRDMDLALARLDLAEGQTGDAVMHARAAMAAFTSAGREADRLAAAAVLIRALTLSRKTDEASRVLREIPAPDGKPLAVRALVEFRIARCLLLAKTGQKEEAAGSMKNLLAETVALNLPALEREAQGAQAVLH